MFSSFARRLLAAGGISVALVLGAQAVLAAPPSKIAVGTAYTKASSGSVDNSNFATVVSMAVPVGKYTVSGRITVSNTTGATIDQMACNAYGNTTNGGDVPVDTGDGSNLLSGLATSFPIDGVVNLPAAGRIRIECLSSSTSSQNVGARLVAVTVADIINAP
jgi:hypothetical protein